MRQEMKTNTEYQIYIGCQDSQLRDEIISENEVRRTGKLITGGVLDGCLAEGVLPVDAGGGGDASGGEERKREELFHGGVFL